MEYLVKNVGKDDKRIAEVSLEGILISTTQDAVDLLGNMYYQDFDQIILYKKNITPDFFDLKNGMAGEMLQKFSNYRVKLAIVGDFSKNESKSVQDFIFESNKFGHINFVSTLERAIHVLSE